MLLGTGKYDYSRAIMVGSEQKLTLHHDVPDEGYAEYNVVLNTLQSQIIL